jgi:NAD(P)-dependent dehydrogenase (short-subunit alcohol dehydrogenase family)
MPRLEGRVALVTGSAQGIGATLARDLAREGARLVVSDIADCTQTVAAIEGEGGEAIGVKADITNNRELGDLVRAAEECLGPVEILVNNASLFSALRLKPFEQIDEDEWDRVMRINVRGTFQAVKAVVPSMVKAGRGKIINISSGTFFSGLAGMMHYVASKGAIVAMTRAMARELGDREICVNTIAPGLTMSEGVENHPDLTQGRAPTVATRVIKRDMLPADLSGVAIFLASADSDFMSGQLLNVDGGKIMY